jgi:DeoR/GlpR family transcriptional regulator of sugar metabolism
MGSHQRQEEIVRLAGATGVPTVEELSTRFSVPASTIRRDLTKLQFLGLLARTCNGAKGLQSHPEDSVRHRNQKPFDAKRGIARWAAQQIHSGETVLLDTGSTVAALARQLRRARALTVVTTSLAVLQELSGAESIQVLCLGGTLRYVSKDFIGPLAEAALERMTFDRAFLGADGIMADATQGTRGTPRRADLRARAFRETRTTPIPRLGAAAPGLHPRHGRLRRLSVPGTLPRPRHGRHRRGRTRLRDGGGVGVPRAAASLPDPRPEGQR